jgi:hypothetical protein
MWICFAAPLCSHLAIPVLAGNTLFARRLSILVSRRKHWLTTPPNAKETIMKTVFTLATLALSLTLGLAPGMASSAGLVRKNPQGGITAVSGEKVTGQNGGTFAGARGGVTDGQGNAVGGSASKATGANGGTFARAGRFQKSADGSASRSGGFAASNANGSASRSAVAQRNADGSASRSSQAAVTGAKGSAATSGSATRSADGTVNANRETTATSAATGNSADVKSSYTSGSGASRTVTCTNAAGQTIACGK